ncbi:hypothetical protein ABZ799_01305 [Nocardiopsis dassonvillei]|uniref:hypothetical protein n=1 Tax=Nocardiopsis dassonvillei TaxID=2014 RepID=UPI0033D4D5F6
MSKKGAPRRYSLAKYAAEATKEPFELDLDDERSVKLKQPTINDMTRVARMVSVEEFAEVFTESEEDAEALVSALGDLPASAMMSLVQDVREHYGLGG